MTYWIRLRWPLHKHCHRSDEARELFKQSLILHFIVSHTQPTQAIQEENGRCEGKETSKKKRLNITCLSGRKEKGKEKRKRHPYGNEEVECYPSPDK